MLLPSSHYHFLDNCWIRRHLALLVCLYHFRFGVPLSLSFWFLVWCGLGSFTILLDFYCLGPLFFYCALGGSFGLRVSDVGLLTGMASAVGQESRHLPGGEWEQRQLWLQRLVISVPATASMQCAGAGSHGFPGMEMGHTGVLGPKWVKFWVYTQVSDTKTPIFLRMKHKNWDRWGSKDTWVGSCLGVWSGCPWVKWPRYTVMTPIGARHLKILEMG